MIADAGQPAPAIHSRTAAFVLLVGMILVWGVHWVVAKAGLSLMGPFTYALLRITTGLATAIVISGVRGRARRPDRADIPIVLSVGLGQVAAGIVLMNLALGVMPAGRSAVLVYTMPLWVALFLVLGFRLRPSRGEGLGLVLGLAGVGLLLNPVAIPWSSEGEVIGATLLLVSAMTWGITTIHVRRHRWRASPLDLQPWQFLVALVPLAILALAIEPGLPVEWSLETVLVLAYSGPLATAFAMWASQSITRSLGPQSATTGFLGVPLVGLASGALVLGERLTLADLAGFALIVGGVIATSRSVTRATAAPDSVPAA